MPLRCVPVDTIGTLHMDLVNVSAISMYNSDYA